MPNGKHRFTNRRFAASHSNYLRLIDLRPAPKDFIYICVRIWRKNYQLRDKQQLNKPWPTHLGAYRRTVLCVHQLKGFAANEPWNILGRVQAYGSECQPQKVRILALSRTRTFVITDDVMLRPSICVNSAYRRTVGGAMNWPATYFYGAYRRTVKEKTSWSELVTWATVKNAKPSACNTT